MAAYAAVVSLLNTIEQVQKHPRFSTSLDKKQMESLQEKAGFLLDFIERDNSHGGLSKEELEGFESQIASAAHAAEDVIECHIVHQIRTGSTKESSNSLQKVIEDVDSVKEKLREVKENWGFKEDSTTATLSRPLDAGKSSNDDVLTGFMEMLAGQSSSRQVIPVVGMGGIGKTTLARNAYENSLIVEYFDIRAWGTISQEYDVCGILSELLSCLREFTDGPVDKLGERLYKRLCGRRYLIVLDDVWSVEVWDQIKLYFPDNGNGSRIVMTTRLSNVSILCGSSSFEMKFLDKSKCWILLREKAFGQEDCPPELVKIGKKIAKKCKGLPLSIVVIGGLLRNFNKTKEYWEKVAENISSILSSGEDEQCMNVLSLSYNQLPPRLKPCFLYMGVFQEAKEIRASQLIKLWVSEGFIKPNNAQSLEEVAECCLKDLIERNLILVRKLGLNQKVKTLGIHDLLRELCLRVAKKEMFFQDMRVPNIPQGNDMECRRIILHENLHHHAVYDALESASLARSLICEGGPLPFIFPLLRVLTNAEIDSPEDILKQVNLRYLRFECSWQFDCFELPSSISLLWNVQTLILIGVTQVHAPSEIWEMQQLRHLECGEICVPDPPPSDKEDDIVLQHLQTFVNVHNFRLSDDVCKRIPNIKKLCLTYDEFYCLNLGRLQNLQLLKLHISLEPRRDDLGQNLAFPSSLRKLSLGGCCLHWEDLTRIGFSLPHLEVLKLEFDSAVGPKWDPVEGAFPRLKFLKIRSCDLIYLTADNSRFPVLEELFLCRLGKLYEIPIDMAGIPTLQCIRLVYCSDSAAISSVNILEEQLSLGNDDFQVQVSFWDETDTQRFLKKVDIKSFARKNFEYSSNRSMIASIRMHAQVIRSAVVFQ